MRTRWLPVLALAVLAPVCAEYLWGYDDSTGHPATLLGNLVVFTPLYGAPALLIREVVRRRGLGWPSIVLLAAAFGVVQAGVVDQSVWARTYRGIPYWSDMADPTYLAPIGLSVFLAVSFVANHVLASMCGPIALVEGLAGRDRWLGRPVVVVLALLYVAASVLVFVDMLDTVGHPIGSPAQVAGAAVAAVALVLAALVPRRSPVFGPGRVPSPWLLLVASGVVFGAAMLAPPSPLGTTALVLAYAGAAAVITRLAHRADFSRAHVTALAAGWLIALAVGSWATVPIGTVTTAERVGHHVVLIALVALTGVLGVARSRVALPR
ncbi:hypothetical protein G5V58_00475 [Nocardioides anomalus]|uniref:Uncharacterized protein n=1 Tax=Nocardioides anomalus TaxID=2712223 RepID=A0A6G6W7Y6_9ACTN|nr:hypothetical protein [Nocardioides anomalus]QIG41448.1 hypothetical protein G5V58_00475 [Nocardioides anomalus]